MFPKNTHRPSLRRQQGNGLVGLLAGLVLATLIIIAVLLVLNSNAKRDFKGDDPKLSNGQAAEQTQPVPQPAPPVATDNAAAQDGTTAPDGMPQDGSTTAPPPEQTASADAPDAPPPAVADSSGGNTGEQQTAAAKPAEEPAAPPPAAKPESGNSAAVAPPPVRRPDPVKSDLSGGSKAQTNNNAASSGSRAQTRPAPQQPSWREKSTSAFSKNEPAVTAKKPAPRPKAQAPARQPSLVDNQGNFQEHQSTRAKTPPKQAAKPQSKPQQPTAKAKQPESGKVTPDMILEYGSLEKARAEAARRAKAKSAPKAQAQSKPAAPPAASGKGGNVVLQAGSYINAKSADAQRANLAMMGVQTKIVEAKVGGKSVYRVQTQGMSGSKAAQTKETLQKNGVTVYQRSE